MTWKEATGICEYCGRIQTDPKYLAFNPGKSAPSNFITCDECISKRIREKQ